MDSQSLYKVCTDEKRVQQIIMNLFSNAIKFTSNGKEIQVKAKYVQDEESLSIRDEPRFVEAIKRAKHGALEIQVIDQGIGINEEN